MSFENTFDHSMLSFVGHVEVPRETKMAITPGCSFVICPVHG